MTRPWEDYALETYGEQSHFPRETDAERSRFSWSNPPLGRWTAIWLEHGYDSKRIIGFAIEEAEANLEIWKRAAGEGYADMNMNLAYERLGAILNWLYVRPTPEAIMEDLRGKAINTFKVE